MADKKSDKGVADLIGKVISVGVGAAFMTEEYVKSIVGELPIPKEIANGLISNAKNTKEEFLKSVKSELHEYLSKVDPKNLVEEVLENYDIEINAKLNFKKKKGE